jgi:hypothetical protein
VLGFTIFIYIHRLIIKTRHSSLSQYSDILAMLA